MEPPAQLKKLPSSETGATCEDLGEIAIHNYLTSSKTSTTLLLLQEWVRAQDLTINKKKGSDEPITRH